MRFFTPILATFFLLTSPTWGADLSGAWQGFYEYGKGPHSQTSASQDVVIRLLGNGKLSGKGDNDFVGDFTIEGSYSELDHTISFIKRYPDHTVDYRGSFSENKISGTWSIRD